jgi:predicted DNA-binding antitoxin AbrB/MazE fold protein
VTITIEAVYEGGVLRPQRPLALKEHTRVQVVIETHEPEAQVGDPAEDFVGFIKDAPEGVALAADHDRYLYGDRRS